MVDPEIIMAKAAITRKHLLRIKQKTAIGFEAFIKDADSQDIILFNIQMAIQSCIDIAAHIISEQGWGVPGSNSEMFYLLEENGYLPKKLSEKMVKAVGFRNLMVHDYARIELDRVFAIAQKDIHDLNGFLKAILDKCGMAE